MQNATATTPLHRTDRQIHYPASIVDLEDPFILLVHQGMVESVFIKDMQLRGVEVVRNSSFIHYSQGPDSDVEVELKDLRTGEIKMLKTQYLVGCEGARSNIRKSMLGAEMIGEPGKAAWGVLDGESLGKCWLFKILTMLQASLKQTSLIYGAK